MEEIAIMTGEHKAPEISAEGPAPEEPVVE